MIYKRYMIHDLQILPTPPQCNVFIQLYTVYIYSIYYLYLLTLYLLILQQYIIFYDLRVTLLPFWECMPICIYFRGSRPEEPQYSLMAYPPSTKHSSEMYSSSTSGRPTHLTLYLNLGLPLRTDTGGAERFFPVPRLECQCQGTSSRAGAALFIWRAESGLTGEKPGSEGTWLRDACIKLKLYFQAAQMKMW